MYIPDKGDIVSLSFDPSVGREIMKHRPAFVISRKAFNQHTGLAIVAPITSTIRGIKLEVELVGTQTKGAVLVHQLKALDYTDRGVTFLERASADLVTKVTDITTIIIQ